METGRLTRNTRRLLIVLAALGVLAIVVRLVLDPVAAWYTRRTLDQVPGIRVAFSGVHVSLLPPAYEIRRCKMIEQPGGRWDEPLFYVERAKVSVLWREILRGHLVGQVELERPKAVAVRRHEEKAKQAPGISRQLDDLAPLKIDRFEVRDGEVLIAQGKGKKAPQLWVNQVDLVATNLATRKAMMEGEPSTLVMRGRVQRSGTLEVDGTLDPWARKPTFTVESQLEGLDVRELHAFVAENAEMRPVSGTVNLFVKTRARNGVLTGGVKPVFENLELRTARKDIGTRLKTFLADSAIEILSDDEPGRDAVATLIPIRGTVDTPDVQLVPTVLGVVRNAFVIALDSGFRHLPPRSAPEKEGVLEQAVNALQKDEGPVEAQPASKGGKEGAKEAGKKSGHNAGENRARRPRSPRR